MADFFGIAGLALILIGWLWELVRLVRKRKATVPLTFALLYCAGSILLAWHSILIGDVVFVALNSFAALVALVNIALNIAGKRKRS